MECKQYAGILVYAQISHWTFVLVQKLNNMCCETFRVCLHIPTPCPSPSPSKFNIVLMVTDNLTGRMGLEPILPVNHRHSVKLLTGTVTASERVNSPLNSTLFRALFVVHFLPPPVHQSGLRNMYSVSDLRKKIYQLVRPD